MPPQPAIGLAFVLVLSVALPTFAAPPAADRQLPKGLLPASDGPAVPVGLLVQLGARDPQLAAALSAGGRRLVEVLDADTARVETARKYFREAGVAPRVWADRWTGPELPYVNDLVNVLVADDYPALAVQGLGLEEIMRVLAPGGRAVLGAKSSDLKTAADRLKLVPQETGRWVTIHKPWPAALDGWTSFEHDAGRSSISSDTVAGFPQGVHWLAGEEWPVYRVFSDPPETLVSSNGRNFYWASLPIWGKPKVVAPESRLLCRDAFNGLTLWTRTLPGTSVPTALVATSDRVYVQPRGKYLQVLDAATGQKIKEFESAGAADVLLYLDGVLLLYRPGTVLALQADDGQLLWQKKFVANHHATDLLAAADGQILILCQEEKDQPLRLLAFDLKTGKSNWSLDVATLEPKLSLKDRIFSLVCCRDGVVLLADAQRSFRPTDQCANYAVSAKDGKVLWTYRYPPTGHGGRATSVMPVASLVWAKSKQGWIGLDPTSGQEQRRIPDARTQCYPDHATPRYILSGQMDFVDLQDGKYNVFQATRSSCGSGFVPAAGQIFTLPTRCHCYPMIRGYLGLAPASAWLSGAAPAKEAGGVEKGPAFAAPPGPAPAKEDWPAYRADARRSAASTVELPAQIHVLWSANLTVPLSSPSAADGKVFVGASDGRVLALSQADGKVLWEFPTSGPVDSPPTYWNGRVLFGSADGWVYCLSAADGKLAWRFRAAPADRQIVVRERLESCWPAHGAVLVQNGVAFVSAGRHTRTDDGITLTALDVQTGQVLWQVNKGAADPPEMNDVLLGGDSLYLGGSLQLDPKTGEARKAGTSPCLYATMGLLCDNSDLAVRTGDDYWRTQWFYADKNGLAAFEKFSGHPKYSRIKGVRGKLLAFTGAGVFGTRQDPVSGDSFAFEADLAGPEKWSVKIPDAQATANSLVVAGSQLVAAGWTESEARTRQGKLWVLSAKDGKLLFTLDLPGVPRWDGLALARGQVLVTLTDGHVTCLGER